MKAISCNGLKKEYGAKMVLEAIDLSIDENKIVGLVGRNGAGKTTFLKICAGHLRPTSGDIKILGEVCFDNLNVLSELIFAGEEVWFDKALRLTEIMRLAATFYENWDGALAKELLKSFGLKENAGYSSLSRGMKSQFNIVMALGSRARVTLLDEPTLGMDIAARKKFYDLLLKDYVDFPRTILISSQLLSEIENLLEEVVFIDKGRILLHKSMDEMQRYAVSVYGRKDMVLKLIEKKRVLHVEESGNAMTAVIENGLTEKEASSAEASNIMIKKVQVEDLFVYLTKNDEDGDENAVESKK